MNKLQAAGGVLLLVFSFRAFTVFHSPHSLPICDCQNTEGEGLGINLNHMQLQQVVWVSLIPRPKSGKGVWCSERHFLSHRAYGIKNVMITFTSGDRLFWQLLLHDMVNKSLIKATKFLRKAENELRGKFFYLQFDSKYDRLLFLQSDSSSQLGELSRPMWQVAQNTRPSRTHERVWGTRLDRR